MSREYAQKFYNSKAWRECRKGYFDSKYGICELCGKPGEEVHHKIHITPQNITDTNITLNWDNLQVLCRSCHNAIHEKSMEMNRCRKRNNSSTQNGLCFDEEGNLVEEDNVYIVWGSPSSGKSKYVKEHKGKYDLVIDLDLIIKALKMGADEEMTQDYLPFALDMRETLYDIIAVRKYHFDKAWIIATLADRDQRIRLKERLKANLIHIDTDEETCLRYAKMDEERKNKELQYKIIKKYFKKLEL